MASAHPAEARGLGSVAGGNDTLKGDQGHDVVSGGIGNDHIGAGDGNDTVDGGDGNDSLWGTDGDDRLLGNTGDDNLYGGADADVFVYSAANNGSDVIHDFVTGVDTMEIAGATFGDLSITASGSDTSVVWSGGQILLLGVDSLSIDQSDFHFV